MIDVHKKYVKTGSQYKGHKILESDEQLDQFSEIPLLDNAIELDGTELTVIIKNGTPYKTTAQDIANLGGGGSSYTYPVVVKTANYTLTANDVVVICHTNNLTITLPSAVGIEGRFYIVKALYLFPNAVTIQMATTLGQTIDNSAASGITVQSNRCKKFISDGANWVIIDFNN